MDLDRLTIADLPAAERVAAGQATLAETVSLLAKCFPGLERQPAGALRERLAEFIETFVTLNQGRALRKAMLIHLGTGGEMPDPYLELYLCRVYHCSPAELARVPLPTLINHLHCLGVEHQVRSRK